MGPNDPPSPLPMPPAAAGTPHGLNSGPACPVLGQQANCGEKRAQLCPCGPSGRQPEACAHGVLDLGQAQALTSQPGSRLRSCQS